MVIVIKAQATEKFRSDVMLLFYILQKCHLDKAVYFSTIYHHASAQNPTVIHSSILQFRVSAMLFLLVIRN
jgi:hypothetical protein